MDEIISIISDLVEKGYLVKSLPGNGSVRSVYHSVELFGRRENEKDITGGASFFHRALSVFKNNSALGAALNPDTDGCFFFVDQLCSLAVKSAEIGQGAKNGK